MSRSSNFRHVSHSISHRLHDKKNIIVLNYGEVSNLPIAIVLNATGRLNQCKHTDLIQNYDWPSSLNVKTKRPQKIHHQLMIINPTKPCLHFHAKSPQLSSLSYLNCFRVLINVVSLNLKIVSHSPSHNRKDATYLRELLTKEGFNLGRTKGTTTCNVNFCYKATFKILAH